MNGIFLSLLLLTAFSVAWIEWIPKRYVVFLELSISLSLVSAGIGWMPEWHGWVVLLMGIAGLARIYFSPKRRKEWPNLFSAPARALRDGALAVKSAATSAASRRRDRKLAERADSPREKTNFLTTGRMRNAAGAVCAVLLSPIAALPSAFVLSVLLVLWNAFFGNSPQVVGDLQEIARRVLGISYVSVVATLDLFARYLWISGPLLLAAGYAITAYSVGSGVFWQRYSRGLLLFGTIYPIVFVAASVFSWFDGPFYN